MRRYFGGSGEGSLTAGAEQKAARVWLTAPFLRHAPPTRPTSKGRASGWEIRSTFCSQGPDQRLGQLLLGGDSLRTKRENSVRKRATVLGRAPTLLRTFPW